MTHNHLEELTWILSRVRACDGVNREVDGYGREVVLPRVYLLEQVINDAKDYSAADVHSWGREMECAGVYGKIRDILKVRMIETDAVDKALKLKHLAAFDGYVDKVESKVSGSMVVNIMREGADL